MDEEKLKLPKFYRIYLMLLVVLVVALIVPTSREKIFDALNIFRNTQMELEAVSEFPVEEGVSDIGIYGENIIIWEDNQLLITDINGNQSKRKNYDFEDGGIFFGDELFYVMGKSKGEIQLVNKEGKIQEKIQCSPPFEKIDEEDEKVYIYKKDGDIETVDIVNKEGDLLKTHEERIPILLFAMGNKDEEYMVSTLDIVDDLNSLVDVYSLDEEQLGSYKIEDELAVYGKFIKKELVLVTDKGVYLFKNGEEKWKKEITNLKDVKLVGKEIHILYDGKFQTLNLRGKIKEDLKLELPLDGIKVADEGIILFGKENIIIPNSDENLLEFKSKGNIIDLKYGSGKLLVQLEDKIEVYNIKEKGEDVNE